MNQVFEDIGVIAGAGVVSPAGWGMGGFVNALEDGVKIPEEAVKRGECGFARARRVPKQPKELRIKSPRLRRVSPVTKYLVAASKEALDYASYPVGEPLGDRVGLVVAFMNGCVNYTNRFFGEVLDDPAMASPILFPETVFNAPASHVATVLGADGPVATVLGDSAALGEAIRTAALWNATGETDACIVACGEEVDWLSAEGLSYYGKNFVASEGAAAFLLTRNANSGVEIQSMEQLPYTSAGERASALRQFGDTSQTVRSVLGEGMGVAAGFDLAEKWAWCREGCVDPVESVFSGTNASAYKLILDSIRYR